MWILLVCFIVKEMGSKELGLGDRKWGGGVFKINTGGGRVKYEVFILILEVI